MSLELRPCCENCSKPLPPAATDARICSFECTFCAICVDEVLGNVCPNCGGGFTPRPIRPAQNWKGDNFVGAYPPSTVRKVRPVDRSAHERFAAMLRALAPEKR